MNAEQIKVRRGEKVADAWKRLVRWVESAQIIPNPSVRLTVTSDGTTVEVVRKPSSFAHPWKVSAGTDFVTMRSGLVSEFPPFIKDRKSRTTRKLDGTDAKGREHKDGQPELSISPSLTDKLGRAWILLRASLSETSATWDGTNPNIFEVIQSDTPRPDTKGQYAFHPLAMLRVGNDGAIGEVFQIAMHNLRLAVQTVDGGKRGLFIPY